MKKFFLSAAIALLAVSVSAQDYRDDGQAPRPAYSGGANNRGEYGASNRGDFQEGRWAIGPQIGVYTNTDTDNAVFGIGAIARYNFSQHWRIQPSIMALCKKDCSVDITADLQYLFRLTRSWDIYPQVGFGGNDFNGWSFGVNLGAATDFAIARRWDLSAGFKWIVQTKKDRKNPILINIGATYKF